MKKGTLCISLDFEKFWGIHDVSKLKDVEQNMLKVSDVVSKLLALFKKYDIHCTWAVVGLLGFSDLQTLKNSVKTKRVPYLDSNLSPFPLSKFELEKYNVNSFLGQAEINLIKQHKHQELASHTFSHYYCLEKGVDIENFTHDMTLFKKYILEEVKSIVFPRNQIKDDCLNICAKEGVVAFRGNQKNKFWKNTSYTNEKLIQKIGRTLDAYIKISKDNLIEWQSLNVKTNGLVNIPASRFFKPAKYFKLIESLKLSRIKKQMLKSAQTNQIYHLWWHPHNFSTNTAQNFEQLENLLIYFNQLKKDYGYQSLNMNEIAQQIG